MSDDREYITKEKKEQMEQELEILRGSRRREILTQLEYAKALGDLSENAEYHEARELQGKNEDRIRHIEHILKTSIVTTTHSTDYVGIGSTVKVKRQDSGDEKILAIVGSEDADISAGKISHHSPLGQALFQKKVGDTATLVTPRGEVIYTIISIS